MRVSEVYLSVQGEGPNVGFPTVFVRFGGCNLRCPLWPCDTPYAIFPEYRSEWLVQTPVEIVDRVVKAAGDMRFFNVCLTGGEPFLQKHSELKELVDELTVTTGCLVIESFSNGALAYPEWMGSPNNPLEVVMDWKLPGSGEGKWSDVRLKNIRMVSNLNLSIKFTIADREDYEVAKQYYFEHLNDTPVEVFAGVVWGKLENQELVDWILADGMPWRLNIQVHNHIWDRSLRGI